MNGRRRRVWAYRTTSAFVALAALTASEAYAYSPPETTQTVTSHPFTDECRTTPDMPTYDPNDPKWWPTCTFGPNRPLGLDTGIQH